ncbi:MAG: hypothetical protein U0R80_19305 [Nocardioidaceae bacterium]
MCSPVRCRSCSKVTWSGCGQHVEAVLSRFPAEERCECQTSQQPVFDLSRFLGR